MDLVNNPFHILAATPRDNRHRIMELADERSLLFDPAGCAQARSDLLNPRKRLAAEMAWLPGVSPKRSAEIIAMLESSPADVFNMTELVPLAHANLLASGIARIPSPSSEDIAKWMLAIAWAFESIDQNDICRIINEERIAAGYHEVTDIAAIEFELQERRQHYCKSLKATLNTIHSAELVKAITIAVESATDIGEKQGPVLLDDLVDAYEVEAQCFLAAEEANITILLAKFKAAADAEHSDATLNAWADRLIDVIKNWDLVAQPIQVSTKSRGLRHGDSQRLADLVRDLAIDLWNKHGKLELAQRLTDMLQGVFAEVVTVAEKVTEDIEILKGIEDRQNRIEADAQEWAEEISLDVNLGSFFPKRFKISPEGIVWKNKIIPLAAISKLRWWKIHNTQYGRITSTDFFIVYGNKNESFTINVTHEGLFSQITKALWRSVGFRLISEYVKGLRDGNEYSFGSVLIDDYGITFPSQRIFSSETFYCLWKELVIWNIPGFFCIGKKGNKDISAEFSYERDDNIHVLEAAINIFWKKGGDRLSSIFGE